jgi:uncharacterized protein YhaN
VTRCSRLTRHFAPGLASCRPPKRDRQAAVARLHRLLAPLDPEAITGDSLEKLQSRAQHLLNRETRLEGYRRTLTEQDRLLVRRKRDVENAEAEARAWMLSWKQAIEGCWLGKGLKAPTAAEVREALPLLAELATAINERQGLADRIAKMERDQFDYAAALQATAAAAGCETGDTPPGAHRPAAGGQAGNG